MDWPEELKSKRLILRPYRKGDGLVFYEAGQRNQDHLSTYESENILLLATDVSHSESLARQLASDWVARKHFIFALFDQQTDDWVGQIYVGPTNWDLPAFHVGYAADIRYEGKGYISEGLKRVLDVLFNVIGARRVSSECHEGNTRSWRLLERCGFKREGHLRENKKQSDGSFQGDFIYGLLKREYKP